MRSRFRSRFTDGEWKLYKRGRCCWPVAYGTWSRLCGQRSKPGHPFGYCCLHAREAGELFWSHRR